MAAKDLGKNPSQSAAYRSLEGATRRQPFACLRWIELASRYLTRLPPLVTLENRLETRLSTVVGRWQAGKSRLRAGAHGLLFDRSRGGRQR